jgi:ribosome-associated protein
MQDEFVSKTKRKQEMHELQKLGAALVELPESKLKELALDAGLHQAVLEAKRITAHGGKRRQLQYIGKLMRDIDPAPIRAMLDDLTGSSTAAAAAHKRLEALRARLLADDDALSEYAAAHPKADLQMLRTLIRNSRQEYETGRPPRAYRELFRLLKSIESSSSIPG